MKKFLLLTITLLSATPLWAVDEEDFTYNGIKYTVISEDDKTCRTKAGSYESSGNQGITGDDLVIPSIAKNTANETEYTVIEIGEYSFLNCESLTGALTLPESLKTIGEGAFQGCSNLVGGVTIPQGVTVIPSNAFKGCSSFNGNLNFSDSLISIGDYAFQNCSGFTGSILLPETVTTLGNYAFYDCSRFTGNLKLPGKVLNVPEGCFKNCSGLDGSLTLPENLMTIGDNAFEGCADITGSLILPATIYAIGEAAFKNCAGFSGDVTVPSGVTVINTSTFEGCAGLSGYMTLPSTLTSIGEKAFYDATNIRNIRIKQTTPPDCANENIFSATDPAKALFETACLLVPVDYVETYKAAKIWGNFKKITEDLGELYLRINNFSMIEGGFSEIVAVNLEFSEKDDFQYKAFQFDIIPTDGLIIENATLNDELTGWTLSTDDLPEGGLRVRANSSDDQSTSSLLNGIVSITISAPWDINPTEEAKIHLANGQFFIDSDIKDEIDCNNTAVPVIIKNTRLSSLSLSGVEEPTIKVDDIYTVAVNFTTEGSEPGKAPSVKDLKWEVGSGYIEIVEDAALPYGSCKIKGLRPGTSTLRVTSTIYNKSASINVTVIPRIGITLSSVSMEDLVNKHSLKQTEELYFTANIDPDDAEYEKVIWSVSPAGYATFEDTGEDNAKDKGTSVTAKMIADETSNNVVITATIDDTGVKATYVVTVSELLPGDANDSGEVNVADVSIVIGEILERDRNLNFCFVNADVNADKEIDVSDQAAVQNISLGKEPFTQNKSRLSTVYEDCLIAKAPRNTNGVPEVGISLENPDRYIILQADIEIEEGSEIASIKPGVQAARHQIEYNRIDENLVRVIVYSALNESFVPDAGDLFVVSFTGTSDFSEINIANIIAVDYNGRKHRLGFKNENSSEAGIDNLEILRDLEIYNLQGMRINTTGGLTPGIYIINGKKVVVK